MELSNNIYTEQNALSIELCNDIIDIFETNQNIPMPANTLGGVQPQVLNAKSIYCTDIVHPDWQRIAGTIQKHTITRVKQYFKKIIDSLDIGGDSVFVFFDDIIWKGFSVNKYLAVETGHYNYHIDRHSILETDEERIVTFIYYLQDVANGGETCFPGQGLTVKPEAGKLVLFPSTWTYPHCAKIPISTDKYIITGWFYKKHTK